ncbi:hypothetical protein [Flavobacterium psychrophilum]|uniref:hypothetical protein n=1 Tax=Flavobacterium psychrophilum TaxID=96345 RepID=UPI001D0929BA|nr:hypothetical protein [Flavobacterium psychrophilum]MCB6097725.1 hypothetical protein [Flavobacterium psychrophilum]
MILLEKIEQYGAHLLAEIPDLKKFYLVVNDSQIVKVLNEINEDDNLILIGFIPSHKSEGTNQDNVQNRDFSLWMVLNKVDRNDGQEAFIASFKRTQIAASAIEKQMLTDKPNFGGQCSLMRQLQVASIEINPVWALAGCDGYEINYQLLTPIY